MACLATTDTMRDVSREAQWTIDHPDVAAVDAGTVTAKAAGDTVVRARVTVGPGATLEAVLPVIVLPGMQPMPAFDIRGTVRSTTNQPLDAVRIEIVAGHQQVEGRTTMTGVTPAARPGFVDVPVAADAFRLTGIPPGLYVLKAAKAGYREVTALVDVKWDAGRVINFSLAPQ